MKKIGLNHEILSQIGMSEFYTDHLNRLDSTSEIGQSNNFSAEWNELAFEAIIKSVAVMIEQNNNELLKQLKSAGVLPDQ
ncbi:hypothetical protein [Paenibacillus motobuensis]|uniref:Uncharacterized protein n=1 Tax=Paenibacillus motobuensis TaxID=295324 RepID=A0ABP3I4B4_9BACL